MNCEQMSKADARHKFLSDHRILRAKAAVVTTLALNLLRGDEDLASALRLKGEELHAQLLDHMKWEETQLVPLLAGSSIGESVASVILEEHADQRLHLMKSLAELQRPDAPCSTLAKDCIALVRWLESDMAREENEVQRSIEIGD